MNKADAQPSVNVRVRADPIVLYTINSTVNDHSFVKIVAVVQLLRNALGIQQIPPTWCSTGRR